MTRAQAAHLKAAFLESFKVTGNISESCGIAGVVRRTIYKWQEHDDEFLLNFREAEVQATEYLETAARSRAVDGVTTSTPILHQGKVVYTIEETKYSDTLLIFLLKARAPDKYRERVDVKHGGRVEHVGLNAARQVLRVDGGAAE